MKAFAYTRVSTGEQAQKYSLEAQRDEIAQYCAAHGIEVVEWFEDHLSGTKLVERAQLMALLDRAEEEVALVVATETDRVARDLYQFGWIATHLQMQGVELRIIHERPAETPMEKAFQRMQAVFAEFETELRQWRINRGRAKAREQNQFMSRPPLGYVIHRGKVVIDSERQREVEELFQRYGAGESMAALARSLGKGRRAIAYILKNPFYVDPGLHGEHEVFLDEALFQQAQERIPPPGREKTPSRPRKRAKRPSQKKKSRSHGPKEGQK